MEKAVEVEISYCDKDIKQAISYKIIRINMMWIFFLCFLLFIIAVLLYYLKNGFTGYSTGFLSVLIVSALLFFSIYYQFPVNRYVDFYRKRKGGVYTFSNQEVKIAGEEVQSVCAWSVFKRGYDIPKALLLEDTNRFIYVFPKRCFKTDSDIQLLQLIMKEKIPNFRMYK